MAQQFDKPLEPGTEPRSQRMTAEESRAVIDLWQQEQVEQTGLTDKPAVPDVAEGLDITVEDVRRLLMEVRARRLEEEHALTTERELSEIRLAEEERKLAEVRRQRAEVERQQAEAVRRTASVRRTESGWPAGWAETRRRPHSERLSQSELGSRYIKRQKSSPGYKTAAFLIAAALSAFYRYVETPHPPARVYVTHAGASYDAQGKASVVDMTCGDGLGQTVPCDDATISSETQYFQEAHDKELADMKQAADKKAAAKKEHDKQAHR